MLCEKVCLVDIADTRFHSYLINRKQIVCANNCLSEEKNVTCGVPQGSLLGPLCCLFFSNDMPSCVNCKVILYADDTIPYVSHQDAKQVQNELSEAAKTCFQWLANNRLSMHSGETVVLVFSSKSKRSEISNFSIVLEVN